MSVVTGIKIGNTIYNVNDTSALPLSGGTMTGSLNMNNNDVTNVKTPTTSGGATNKEYVDDIVEYGTDSTISGITWTYRKWGNGTSECWGTYAISNYDCSQSATGLGNWYHGAGINIAFPTNLFNSTPKIFKDYTTTNSAGAIIWNYGADSSTAAGSFYLIRPTSITGLYGSIYIYAIGTYTT